MNKQKTIQIIVTGIKITSALGGLAAYTNILPQSWTPYCVLAFALVSAGKEVLTALDIYLEGPAAVQTAKVQANLPDPKV